MSSFSILLQTKWLIGQNLTVFIASTWWNELYRKRRIAWMNNYLVLGIHLIQQRRVWREGLALLQLNLQLKCTLVILLQFRYLRTRPVKQILFKGKLLSYRLSTPAAEQWKSNLFWCAGAKISARSAAIIPFVRWRRRCRQFHAIAIRHPACSSSLSQEGDLCRRSAKRCSRNITR